MELLSELRPDLRKMLLELLEHLNRLECAMCMQEEDEDENFIHQEGCKFFACLKELRNG